MARAFIVLALSAAGANGLTTSAAFGRPSIRHRAALQPPLARNVAPRATVAEPVAAA
jgi:hypothetical protein